MEYTIIRRQGDYAVELRVTDAKNLYFNTFAASLPDALREMDAWAATNGLPAPKPACSSPCTNAVCSRH